MGRSILASGARALHPPSGYFMEIIALGELPRQSETARQMAPLKKSENLPPWVKLARSQP